MLKIACTFLCIFGSTQTMGVNEDITLLMPGKNFSTVAEFYAEVKRVQSFGPIERIVGVACECGAATCSYCVYQNFQETTELAEVCAQVHHGIGEYPPICIDTASLGLYASLACAVAALLSAHAGYQLCTKNPEYLAALQVAAGACPFCLRTILQQADPSVDDNIFSGLKEALINHTHAGMCQAHHTQMIMK